MGTQAQTRWWGTGMTVLMVRWAAGCAAVGSVVLGVGALALAYVDRL